MEEKVEKLYFHKKRCPITTYPTDCKVNCTDCECGGYGMTHGLIDKAKLLNTIEELYNSYYQNPLFGISYLQGIHDMYEQIYGLICETPSAEKEN